mgnify:CR=1 FL=1
MMSIFLNRLVRISHSLLVGRWLVDHGWPKVLHFVQGYSAWQAAGHQVETESDGLKMGQQQ